MPATSGKFKRHADGELGQLSSEPARRKFLAQHKKLFRQEIVEQLAQMWFRKSA